MADLVRLAYYPFLPEVRDAVRQAGPDLGTLLSSPQYQSVRDRAVARIEGSLGDGFSPVQVLDERDALRELLSVPVARMLCVALGEKVLRMRYAQAEARRVHDTLTADPDPEAIPAAAAALSLRLVPDAGPSGFASPESGARELKIAWRMKLADYLKAAPNGVEWKLILRPVARGQVPVTKGEAARLVQEALARRIAEELEAEALRKMPEGLRAALAPALALLEPKLEEARDKWSEGDFGPVQPGLFPPCVKEIFEQLKQGKNLPHHARFAMTTFLNIIGWGPEQIMDYLSSTPNFDRDKSRYQIEHITGQKGVEAYMVPNCSTMQTNGICPLAQRDQICFRVKNPLSYYRKRLWMAKRDEERAAMQRQPVGAPVPNMPAPAIVTAPTLLEGKA